MKKIYLLFIILAFMGCSVSKFQVGTGGKGHTAKYMRCTAGK